MSLGIAFKGPEGIVLSADSRVTLNAFRKQGNETFHFPATYDNATKLLKVNGHKFIGAVTYGLGSLSDREPRTAHSYIPEFEEVLKKKYPVKKNKETRLTVEVFAKELSSFFMTQWKRVMPETYEGPSMVFIVGGYDSGDPYGKVYEFYIPNKPDPKELHPKEFGITWGGQLEFTTRLIKGHDPSLIDFLEKELNLTDAQKAKFSNYLASQNLPVPYAFLPLQDCVDMSIYLIRTTMELQNWMIGNRGVGGAIDVATITRTEGFTPIQEKHILGER